MELPRVGSPSFAAKASTRSAISITIDEAQIFFIEKKSIGEL